MLQKLNESSVTACEISQKVPLIVRIEGFVIYKRSENEQARTLDSLWIKA